MTVKNWYAHPDRRRELEELLASPTLLEALDILLNQGLPKATVCPSGMDYVQWQAISGSRREGYFEFYRNLKTLSQQPVGRTKPAEPWDSGATQ